MSDPSPFHQNCVKSEIGYFQEQVLFYKKYLKLAQMVGDRRGEGVALNNLGNTYYKIGQYQQAIDFHRQRLAIAREIGN